MTQPQTCGEGLAQNSPLPIKLGELAAAIAGNLEAHMPALDTDDANAAAEHRAYVEEELLAMLTERLEPDRQMLGRMRSMIAG
jgi:hypothetical protein